MEVIELEKEWMSKYDLSTGRLKSNLTDDCYTWVQTNNERTEELIKYMYISGLNDCYIKIIELLDEWVDIPIEHKKIISIWVIGTYVHKELDSFPYLLFNAMRGSGKTRLLEIISWIQKNGNGEVLTNPSDSHMFRTAKERGLIIDEFESEKSKDKQAMREYLNACYKRGGIVYRMEKQKEKQVSVGHSLFTPVAMANINGVEEVLSDRCITIIIEKSNNPYITKKVQDFHRNPKIKTLKENLEKFSVGLCSVYPIQKAIDDWNLYITSKYNTSIHSLHTIHNYTQLYNTLEMEEMLQKIDKSSISGRNLELFLPLALIAKSLNRALFDEILDILLKLNQEKKDNEFTDSKDVSLIEFVASADRYRFEYVKSSKLLGEFKIFLGENIDENDFRKEITWFGTALRRLKLYSQKKREASGQFILLNVDHAKEKLKIFKDEEK